MDNGYQLLGSLRKENGDISRICKPIDTESRLEVARGWEGRMGTNC